MNLQQKLENRLKASKFRLVNEKISKASDTKLKSEDIKLYHEGYADTVKKWPVNPLDIIIQHLAKTPNLKIADIGCGEAKLSKILKSSTVSSFDLYPASENIIKATMDQIPLENMSMDVVVYCLSLMKRNVGRGMKEANRICKIGGVVYIAEVVSRIECLETFVRKIENVGFVREIVDESNKYFVLIKLVKTKDCDIKEKIEIFLKTYKYKKR